MTTAPTKTRIPNPLYAAAGAADYAYEKLRDLQAKVVEQRPTSRELDIEHLRGVARRNAKAFVSSAQAAQENLVARAHEAQEKAVAFYTDLVVRGEKVVRGRARAAEHTVGEIADTAAADVKRTTRRAAAPATHTPAPKAPAASSNAATSK
jgi:heparin binding hemagglutinin HbhA